MLVHPIRSFNLTFTKRAQNTHMSNLHLKDKFGASHIPPYPNSQNPPQHTQNSQTFTIKPQPPPTTKSPSNNTYQNNSAPALALLQRPHLLPW
jgi:hypothetical protein